MAGKALIEHGRFLDVLGIEVALLAEAAGSARADTPVPACPGFTVGEVVRHVGGVYRVARRWLIDGEEPGEWQRGPVPGQSTADYLRAGLAELLGELSGHDPEEPAAGWWPEEGSYGFWSRRLAHETTIHRYDVQEAVDALITPIAEDLATDGVDEALAVWFGGRLPMLGLSGITGRSVAVRIAGHHWIARAGPGKIEARRCSAEEAARADGLVSGSPMPVYLWLWGRQGHQAVTWERDEDAIGQFWALLRLATR